ncbi:putative FMN dependent dehydrogenase [Xylariaceae sp. FL0804]|nr:putative FMN dependent dehydrogenase [Xylariaceae sp. FL0804]
MTTNTPAHPAPHPQARPAPSAPPADDPDPLAYEAAVYERGLRYQRPPFTFRPLEWEALAEQRMAAESRGYVVGSAGTGETARKNRAAFARWSIVPRRLVKTDGFPELGCRLFGGPAAEGEEEKKKGGGDDDRGIKVPFPIACAPIGVMKIMNPDGEVAAARAAARERVPYIMSTASSTSIEDVAKANGDGVRWFQLYWPSREHDDITISMLQRARKAGFSALFVTLDTYILGWRPSDMDNGYNPFLRSDQIGVAIGLTDPVFRAHFKGKHGCEVEADMGAAVAEWTRTVFPGRSHGFEDLAFLRQHWDGPIVLKGIQSAADARRCADAGVVDGIVVSNHGGRQSDGGCSSLGALPGIVDAVGDRLDVLFDSGVRCGADVAKALALGARMCLVGRPYVYGLVLGGEEGVAHVLKSLMGDLELTLHLAGIPSSSPEHLNRSVLVKEEDLF